MDQPENFGFSRTAKVEFNIEYLVIAGGGGGGTDGSGAAGGGGAGGYRTNVSGATSGGGSSTESSIKAVRGIQYTVTVGGGRRCT